MMKYRVRGYSTGRYCTARSGVLHTLAHGSSLRLNGGSPKSPSPKLGALGNQLSCASYPLPSGPRVLRCQLPNVRTVRSETEIVRERDGFSLH
jgi:hypothetical protein